MDTPPFPLNTTFKYNSSLVLGLLVLIPLLPAALAVILGVFAKRRIDRSNGRYVGKGLATAGIILGSLQGVYWIYLTLSDSFYTVQSHEVAIITQMGRIIGEPKQPGLQFKAPFIQKANRIPVGVYFEWQSKALEFVTSDGQRITLRAKMRYRICDPVRYIQTGGLAGDRLRESRIEDIFYADIMEEANKHPLNEFALSVRNLSLQKTLHSNFSTKLNLLGICMHKVDEPYDVLETSS